jgi:hypothetical protein
LAPGIADQLFQLTTLIDAWTLQKQQHGTFSNFKGVFVPSSYLLPLITWLNYWMDLVGLLDVFVMLLWQMHALRMDDDVSFYRYMHD